jgi:phosphatidate cytidylyltransferase
MLRTRLIVGSVMIAGAVLATLADCWLSWESAPLFGLLTLVATMLGVRELSRLLPLAGLPVEAWFCHVGCAAIVIGTWTGAAIGGHEGFATHGPMIGGLCGAGISLVAMIVACFALAIARFNGPGRSVQTVAGRLFALVYLGLFPAIIVLIRRIGSAGGEGAFWVMATVFVTKFCDTGAYFTGKWLGRRKLAPALSPGKTIEGAIGGLATAVALAFALVHLGECLLERNLLAPPVTLAFGILVGVAGQAGDLIESMVKREGGQKDASNDIPGFGGVLDVIDSILLSGPVALAILLLGSGK